MMIEGPEYDEYKARLEDKLRKVSLRFAIAPRLIEDLLSNTHWIGDAAGCELERIVNGT